MCPFGPRESNTKPAADLPPTRDRRSRTRRHDTRLVDGTQRGTADAAGSELGKPGGSVRPDRDPVGEPGPRQWPVGDLAVRAHPSNPIDPGKSKPDGSVAGHRNTTPG